MDTSKYPVLFSQLESLVSLHSKRENYDDPISDYYGIPQPPIAPEPNKSYYEKFLHTAAWLNIDLDDFYEWLGEKAGSEQGVYFWDEDGPSTIHLEVHMTMAYTFGFPGKDNPDELYQERLVRYQEVQKRWSF